jgi:hypothetical protein
MILVGAQLLENKIANSELTKGELCVQR